MESGIDRLKVGPLREVGSSYLGVGRKVKSGISNRAVDPGEQSPSTLTTFSLLYK